MNEPLANLRFEDGGLATVAVFSGEVDLSNAHELERRLAERTFDAPAILLDLSALTYLDSSGVALIERVAQTALANMRPIRVVAPESSAAGRVTRLVTLHEAIPHDDTLEDALERLASEARSSPG